MMNNTTIKHAVYLPAVQSNYAEVLSKPLPDNRPFPGSMTLTDLAFWQPNGLWHYPFLLHSLGLYKVGALPDNAVTQRTPGKSILVGDSGGYQLGKGSLSGLSAVKDKPMKADEAESAWTQEQDARRWIAGWLETYTDYAMTLDMPLWVTSKSGEGSPFQNCTSEQLTRMTVNNLKCIERYRQGRTKWLNVVQGGANPADIALWWDAVKWFRYGGWALAGSAGARGGLYLMLRTLLQMRDEKAFDAGQDWVHILGASTPMWSIMFTAIQTALRVDNANLQVSFDTSSPFLIGWRFESIAVSPSLDSDPNSWAISTVLAPQSGLDLGSSSAVPAPFAMSPIGKRLHLGHLSVRGGDFQERQYDSISTALIAHHNVWVHVDAFERANNAVSRQDTSMVPEIYSDAIGAVADVFQRENWRDALDAFKKVLDKVAPNTYIKK
jgi:hypothetical protein